MSLLKAAIYARYSIDKQKESSLEDQFRICQLRAENEGFEVISLRGDDGISGSTPVAERPGGAKLLEEIYADRIQILIVEGLDRISRDQVEQERIVRRLEYQGINIIGVADGYDSRMGNSRKVLRGIRGLINEMYLEDLRHKTHRGQEGQVNRGYAAGGKSYGYQVVRDKNGSRFEILGEEADWVRWIFRKYADGWSIQRITHTLNQLGASSPRGKSWAVSAIYGSPAKGSGILNNKLYIGQYIWNRSQWVKNPDTGKSKRIDRPTSEWVVVDSPQLRIVTDETWQAVRNRMDCRKKIYGGRLIKTLFSGLMRCPKCNGPIIATSQRYYGCNYAKDRGPSVCTGFYLPREQTETRFLEIIQQQLLTDDAQKTIATQIKAILLKRREALYQSASTFRVKLTKIDEEIQRLVDAIAAIGISPALQARLQAAEAQRKKTAYEIELGTKIKDSSISDASKIAKHITMDLQAALSKDSQRSREIISSLMGNITLSIKNDGIYAEYDKPAEKLLLIATSMSRNQAEREENRNIDPRTYQYVSRLGCGGRI